MVLNIQNIAHPKLNFRHPTTEEARRRWTKRPDMGEDRDASELVGNLKNKWG